MATHQLFSRGLINIFFNHITNVFFAPGSSGTVFHLQRDSLADAFIGTFMISETRLCNDTATAACTGWHPLSYNTDIHQSCRRYCAHSRYCMCTVSPSLLKHRFIYIFIKHFAAFHFVTRLNLYILLFDSCMYFFSNLSIKIFIKTKNCD